MNIARLVYKLKKYGFNKITIDIEEDWIKIHTSLYSIKSGCDYYLSIYEIIYGNEYKYNLTMTINNNEIIQYAGIKYNEYIAGIAKAIRTIHNKEKDRREQ